MRRSRGSPEEEARLIAWFGGIVDMAIRRAGADDDSNPAAAEASNGFEAWAHGFSSVVAKHAIPPVARIGAVAWLARVALHEERAS